MSALLDATNATPQALVGTRIRDDNDFRGTIRYVGPVATSTKDPNATWYGVEWDDNTRGAISASRRVEAPSRRRRASSPGMMEVGGLFFDFEAVRISMLRTGPDGPVRRPGAVAARVRGLAAGAAVVSC